MSKKNITISIVLILSSVCLLYTFKDVQFSKLYELLGQTDFKYIALWELIFVLGTFLRVLRWKFLVNQNAVGFKDLYHSLNVGNLASTILPFRAGEFVRPYYLSQWTNVSFPKVFVSVVIERIFDVLGMFTMFFYFVSGVNNIPAFILISANGLGLITAMLIIGMIISRIFPDYIKSFSNVILNFLPNKFSSKMMHIVDEVIEGLSSIKSFKQLFIIISITLIIWISYAASFGIVLSALNKEYSIVIGAVTCVFVGLAIAAPNAPGFLLTFELGSSAALAVFAYHGEFSLAYALIAHSLQLFSTILIGIFSLWSKGLSISKLRATNS